MKKWFSENKKYIILSTLATFLPTVIGLILYNRLPDQIASHWGADGVVDGFAGKNFMIFVLPAILAVLNLLAMAATAMDPKQKDHNGKAMRMIFWIIPLICLVTTSSVYAFALGESMTVTTLMFPLMGIVFVVIGNYMPKVSQNRSLGIKIYWTLNNEENWNKTHRFAGKFWVAGGFLMSLLMLLPISWALPMMLVSTLLIVLAPVVYSYCIYRQHLGQGITYTASKSSKGQKLLTAALTLALVIFLFFIMCTGDITYTPEETSMGIRASFSADAEVIYDLVDSMELRQDFKIGMRVMGFNSPRLSTGTYQNEELGNYTLYAYTGCDTAILIRSGSNWLAINAPTAEETQALYETLLIKIGHP